MNEDKTTNDEQSTNDSQRSDNSSSSDTKTHDSTSPSSESTSKRSESHSKTKNVDTSIGLKELLIPIAIVIAGALIGLGLFFAGSFATDSEQLAGNSDTPGQPSEPTNATEEVNPVTEEDWIKGNPNAPIKIVEYSDFECPFCKRFHETLQTVMDQNEGEVAWVFRQFPLEQLHPIAVPVSLASECVGELGGDEAFWTFTDGYFRDTLTNNRTDIETVIPKLVIESGVSQEAFTECFESGRHQDDINEDIQNAVDTGGRGTPWSILIGPSGKTYPINGAQTAQTVQQLIELALQEG